MAITNGYSDGEALARHMSNTRTGFSSDADVELALEAGAEDPGAAELLALHPGQVESGPDVQAQDEAFRQVQVVRRRQPAVEGAVRVGRHAEERLVQHATEERGGERSGLG